MNKNELAKNPNTSVGTLDRVSYDESYFVRCFVADNPNTPPETLECMADDKDEEVRYYLASNPNSPQYIRTYLKIKRTIARVSTRS